MDTGQHLGQPVRVVLTALVLGLALAVAEASDSPETADDLPGMLTVVETDRRGLIRDTTYFLGYQAAAIAILYAMPEDVTHWSDEQKEDYSLSIWWENVRNPSWDTDDYAINYLLHPYWGAAYYIRARERGYSHRAGFWYSVLLSSLYEFGAEALFEEPSIQDLVVTPVAGTLVGRYFLHVRTDIRERTAARGYRSTGDKWLWAVTDPLGLLNRGVDRMVGRHIDVDIQPVMYRIQLNEDPVRPAACHAGEWAFGVTIRAAW